MNLPTHFPSYLLPSAVFNSRYHQHLNHLNDMAFTHTKILQEIIEKRSMDSSSVPSSPSSSSISPMAATLNDSIQQKKRSHSCLDNNNNNNNNTGEQHQKEFLTKCSNIEDNELDDNHFNQCSRKQLKPKQLLNEINQTYDDEDDDEQSVSEEEIGEVNSSHEKQVFYDLFLTV